MSASTAWNSGEPPKDGALYMAIGNIKWVSDEGGGSDPFISLVRWSDTARWKGWIDNRGLVIATNVDDTVIIFHWIALPPGWEEAS